jgi:hypothetical protein
MISTSGGVDPDNARNLFLAAAIEVVICRIVDDVFLDFSAYLEAAEFFLAAESTGVIFLNDTLVPKHGSRTLLRSMVRTIMKARSHRFDFPLLVGPYRHSEFSIGNSSVDEFVATFFFYLNRVGLTYIISVVRKLPLVKGALTINETAEPEVDVSLLRLIRIHALQLEARYRDRVDANEFLTRKLATAYAERDLSRKVKADGTVWYVAGGLAGRLMVPIEIAINRFLQRLRP